MLSNSELYSRWRTWLVQVIPDECESRLTNMVHLVVGLYKAGSVQLSKVARKIPVRAQKLSLERRMRRFLDNAGVRVREWYRPLAQRLLEAAASAGQVNLLIDTTKVGFGWRLMMVGWSFTRLVDASVVQDLRFELFRAEIAQ